MQVLGNNLLIADFPNLQKIIINGASSGSARPFLAAIDRRRPSAFEVANCEIKNCPQLKEINISSCQMKFFVTDYLPSLNFLSLCDNLLTELDISKFPNLFLLNCKKNCGLKPISTLAQKIQDKERAIVAPQIRDKNIAIQQLEWEKSELRREMTSLDNIRIGEFNAKKEQLEIQIKQKLLLANQQKEEGLQAKISDLEGRIIAEKKKNQELTQILIRQINEQVDY